MRQDERTIVVSIPSRGRSQHLGKVLEKLAATKSELTTVVVVLNGRQDYPDPGLNGVHFVHIGDVPTIPVAVNFGWYALRRPGSILVKLDNDVLPPDDWEDEVLTKSEVAGLGGFPCTNEYGTTGRVLVGGHNMRLPHRSHTWRIPFLYGGFIWLAPDLAEAIQYEDERFVRSDDGDLGERVSRLQGAVAAYSELDAVHLCPGPNGSTEPTGVAAEMYQVCDLLIKALPNRSIAQETIWSACLSQEEAERLVLGGGALPPHIVNKARDLLRAKLESHFALVGRRDVVDKIFSMA